MNTEQLQYVVGEAKPDCPAVIRFFGPVCSETVERFNDEFLWLQDCVKPSKIVVMINSEGGSIVYGMSTFSIIQSCPIEVHGIIEGIAASMGSIIWAACDKLYMHDYSILMIHNPFVRGGDCEDVNIRNMVHAFRGQLETIYRKRFGMTKEQVAKIMDGEDDADGTYMNAKEAVKAGILAASNIIKTGKQVCDQIKAKIDGVESAESLREIMASAVSENKLVDKALAILQQNEKDEIQANKVMENENVLFEAVAAQLGFPKDTDVASVSTRITELMSAQTELKDVKAKYEALNIQYKGKETEVANLKEQLTDTEAKLKVYQDAEAAAKVAEREALIQSAIDANKIPAESKEDWLALAESNLEVVKTTLDSIPAREVISTAIATEPQNKEAAEAALKTAEELMDAKVKAVLGEDFQLRKIDNKVD